MIERVRCYLLGCYLRGIEADLKGGLKELGWGKNPTEGKLKVGLAETKSDKKKSVWGDFAEYGNLIYPRASLCFTRQGCENQGKEHYMQDMEENKGDVQCDEEMGTYG